ncbi:hypothetical protein G6F68_015237 [Rhizopus microsporus]|nr:hypothetical protein G6F68_015237 [Rhizopus microsporus]
MHAEGARCAAAQAPHRPSACHLGQLLGALHLVQDHPRPRQDGLAEVGQALRARGAVEQANAQVLLQRLDVLADQLRRQIQHGGGGGEGADLGHLGEGPEGNDQVHCKQNISNEMPDYLLFWTQATCIVATTSPPAPPPAPPWSPP